MNQVPRTINNHRIADFIEQDLEGIDNKSTFFNSIYKLPPASSLTIKNKKLNVNKYWQLNTVNYNIHNNFHDYEETFLDLFTTSVRRRTGDAESTGITLSGGIDSASIAVAANEYLVDKNKLNYISATLDNNNDIFEKPYVIDLEIKNKINVLYINERFISNHKNILLDFIIESDDLFDVNMNLIIPLCIYARSKNLKSLIFGVDGDLVCSENVSSVTHLLKRFQLLTALKIINGYAKLNNYSVNRLIWEYALKPFIPSEVKSIYKKIFGKKFLNNNFIQGNGFINKEFSKKINLEERYRILYSQEMVSTVSSIPFHVQQRANLLNKPFVTSAIERYERVCSRFSLESRLPFFDKEFLEFCINIPIHKKIENGINKSILRNSLRKLLPVSIYEKNESFHLGPYYQNIFLDVFQDELNTLVNNNFYPVNEFMNTDFLHITYKNYKLNRDFERHGNYLWRALTLALWLNNYYQKEYL